MLSAHISLHRYQAGSATFDWRLARSARRRSIGLKIDRDGLTVVVPARGTQADAESAIRNKLAWILKHLAQRETLARTAPPVLENGTEILWLGQPHAIASHAPRSKLEDPYLHLRGETPEQLLASFVRFSQNSARTYFGLRVAEFAPQLGVQPRRILLTSARSRWGSCTSAGDIRLNWRLMQAPANVVDYVIVHELCHLLEMNHSARFWAHVSSIFPYWQQQRDWLKHNGHRLLGED